MISSVKVPTGLIVRSSSVSFTSFGGVLCALFYPAGFIPGASGGYSFVHSSFYNLLTLLIVSLSS